MVRALVIAFALGALCLDSGQAVRANEDDVPGHVVLAKPGAKPETGALLIWDATPVVITVVSRKMSDADANAELEHDALRELAKTLKSISPDASTVMLRVTYQKIGAVSPEYGAQTFAGVERYALLSAPFRNLRADKDRWMESGGKPSIPSWFSYSVTGRLPPHH